MASWHTLLLLASLPLVACYDPCSVISDRKWVQYYPLFLINSTVKDNILDVVNKTLQFHTSTNYQVSAPPPFDSQVHEDLIADINRMSVSRYPSEFAFHLDLFQTFRRVNDGDLSLFSSYQHAAWISFIPLPLVLLTDKEGVQHVHIAPEAYNVSKREFKEELEFWENVLPSDMKGGLKSLSGAEVLLIDHQDPWAAINWNAENTGGYQSFATRQNSFFSSYSRYTSWQYVMGNFAQHVHPVTDTVTLTVLRHGRKKPETFTLPYRSRISYGTREFNSSSTYYEANCRARPATNGINFYPSVESALSTLDALGPRQESKFEQQPKLTFSQTFGHPMNVMLDATPLSDMDLPRESQPQAKPLKESYDVAQFYLLEDGETGVLALGSFSASDFNWFGKALLSGLRKLKELGAEKLVVDVTNNGGGYICIAHYLHRIIIGPKDSTEPQAGLDTTARASHLARSIVREISKGGDPSNVLLYNPSQWRNATHHSFPNATNWLKDVHEIEINGRKDAFSQRLGQECQPFEQFDTPDEALFDAKNVVIVSNGRCASSCSLFSITMAKEEGVRTVVVGGRADTQQQYCGVVGGQSTNFFTVDTEIKSTGLETHPDAPPDFMANIVQGITWRLGFGIDDPETPEEWQDHPATYNMPLTVENVNRPERIWKDVAGWAFNHKEEKKFQTQFE
ncbi:hypothetical protein DL96DRAFT_1797327 [Flagelloscypha sp. PMI_526]|nr:hypothetical protein DL96DRAFT_1797327 [Flagelloscypha sp. PMI_526]